MHIGLRGGRGQAADAYRPEGGDEVRQQMRMYRPGSEGDQ